MVERGALFKKGKPERACASSRSLCRPLTLPLASECLRAPHCRQQAGRGKAPSKCAKTGWLWLKWFPLALLHSLQLSDFNHWQFPPHVQPSIFCRPLDECVTAQGVFQLQNSLCHSFPSAATDKYVFNIFIKKERKHIGKYVLFLPAQTTSP